MKAFVTTLTALLIFGCSSNFSTNPTEQSSGSDAELSAAQPANLHDSLDDTEPADPPCETNQTGFVGLRNNSQFTVTCEIGSDTSVTLQPNAKCTIEIAIGSYEVRWHPNEHAYYTEPLFVLLCQKTAIHYDPTRPCHQESAR